jgi:hypothetical protein
MTKTKGKTVGSFESIGCKDGERDITASFTGEDGVRSSATTTLSRC